MAAVPVKMLLTKLRMRLGDMQQTNFSDYELLSALSDAWAMLWIALAENFSTLSRRVAEVTLTNGAGVLPEDFYSLRALSEGTVREGKIEASSETVTLEYNAIPPGIGDAEANIEFPLSLALDLVEVAATVAAGDIKTAAERTGAAAAQMGQKREWARIPDIQHFS